MKSTTIFLLPALASAYTLQFFSDNHCQNDMVDHRYVSNLLIRS